MQTPAVNNWCGRRDSNPHTVRHRLLRPACLPFHHFRAHLSVARSARIGKAGRSMGAIHVKAIFFGRER